MNRITVTAEGRDNIYTPDKQNLIDWIQDKSFDVIHHFMPRGKTLIGADWEPDSVINAINNADQIALTIGNQWKHNYKHALAIITNNSLDLYDIGEISVEDLDVGAEQ